MSGWQIAAIVLALAYTVLVPFVWGLGRAARRGDEQIARLGREPREDWRGTGVHPHMADSSPAMQRPSRPTTTTVRYVEGHRVYEVRG